MSRYKSLIIAVLVAITIAFIFYNTSALAKKPEDEPKLVIDPAEASLMVNEEIQFKAVIQNGDGITPQNMLWRVMGNIGEITPDGWFKASDKPGRGMIQLTAQVENKQQTAYALVKVAEGGALPPGPKKKIVVTVKPGSATVSPGESKQFDVELPGGIPVTDAEWKVVPTNIGSCVNGLFTATKTGKGIIVASVKTDDGVGTGRANVLVTESGTTVPGARLKLKIKPNHARVDKSGSTDFEVELTGNTGIQDLGGLEWSVNPSELGTITPIGDYKATFTAKDIEGRALVTVQLANMTETELGMDWAIVDIGGPGKIAPKKLKVNIEPANASLKLGDPPRLFTVDTSQTPGAEITWSVAPRRLGIINNNGEFTPTSAGWGLIIARINSGKGVGVGKAKIFVGTDSSKPLKIAISPQDVGAVGYGEQIQFTAQITDMQGRAVADQMPIQWKLVPGTMGTIDPSGLFIAGNKAGHAMITAKVEGAKGIGTAQVRITIMSGNRSGRLNVAVSGDESIKVGIVSTYEIEVTDSEGNPINLAEANIKWRVTPANAGEIVETEVGKASFTPALAGRAVIIVEVKTAEGNGSGRISLTITE